MKERGYVGIKMRNIISDDFGHTFTEEISVAEVSDSFAFIVDKRKLYDWLYSLDKFICAPIKELSTDELEKGENDLLGH